MGSAMTGLALAAGGALGAYQAGALLYLAEQRVTFDQMAGSSIGALNAAFCAQGDGSAGHLDTLCQLWRSAPKIGLWRLNEKTAATAAVGMFTGPGPALVSLVALVGAGKLSILDPRPLQALMDRWIDYERVCHSPIGLTIAVLEESAPILDVVVGPWRTATYLSARRLGAAKLKQALLAATAIPLAFPSRNVDGRYYADAGLADALPARPLLQHGCGRIVSIFLTDNTIQDRADYPGCTLFQIRPSVKVDTGYGAIFDVSLAAIERLIDLGYQDARASYEPAQNLFEMLQHLHAQGNINEALAASLPER
jgi:NTE family protein